MNVFTQKQTYRDTPPRFVLSINHLAMVNDESISTSPFAHGPANTLGERSIAIAQEELETRNDLYQPNCSIPIFHSIFGRREGRGQDKRVNRKSYDIISGNLIRFSPCAHDECIIIGNDGNDTDALGFDLLQVLDVAGEMVFGAARRECTYLIYHQLHLLVSVGF